MRLQKPDNNDALHVIVWDPKFQRWLVVRDNPCRLIALDVAIIEDAIKNGFDKSECGGSSLDTLPGVDRERTALINLHNILRAAWRKWKNIPNGIDKQNL